MINKIYSDIKYINIVKDILEHEEFLKLKKIGHHNHDRFTHSLLVSYYAYLKALDKGLDVKAVARGALLHDFFFDETHKMKIADRKTSLKHHPEDAYLNALKYFKINRVEKDIIVNHMYPISGKRPKYKESRLVCMIDKTVSRREVFDQYFYRWKPVFTMFIIFLNLSQGI